MAAWKLCWEREEGGATEVLVRRDMEPEHCRQQSM